MPVMQEVVEEEDENYNVGIVAMQGWRTEMVRSQRNALHSVPGLTEMATRQHDRPHGASDS